ncbi:hypothetical protein GDO78_021314 [Eleutherodactylus coqui]|uniref:Secreted protein n=1 Tax=Eleutherodactylus coqui TaxID=57060 RepID=A0A8J6EHC7_ELECQ|nr:hypothetical protein GDO78_021314 [Eleutherodactylus coqui]
MSRLCFLVCLGTVGYNWLEVYTRPYGQIINGKGVRYTKCGLQLFRLQTDTKTEADREERAKDETFTLFTKPQVKYG